MFKTKVRFNLSKKVSIRKFNLRKLSLRSKELNL
jgi:hypothetical protein